MIMFLKIKVFRAFYIENISLQFHKNQKVGFLSLLVCSYLLESLDFFYSSLNPKIYVSNHLCNKIILSIIVYNELLICYIQ